MNWPAVFSGLLDGDRKAIIQFVLIIVNHVPSYVFFTLSMLSKKFIRQHFEVFLLFFPEHRVCNQSAWIVEPYFLEKIRKRSPIYDPLLLPRVLMVKVNKMKLSKELDPTLRIIPVLKESKDLEKNI